MRKVWNDACGCWKSALGVARRKDHSELTRYNDNGDDTERMRTRVTHSPGTRRTPVSSGGTKHKRSLRGRYEVHKRPRPVGRSPVAHPVIYIELYCISDLPPSPALPLRFLLFPLEPCSPPQPATFNKGSLPLGIGEDDSRKECCG